MDPIAIRGTHDRERIVRLHGPDNTEHLAPPLIPDAIRIFAFWVLDQIDLFVVSVRGEEKKYGDLDGDATVGLGKHTGYYVEYPIVRCSPSFRGSPRRFVPRVPTSPADGILASLLQPKGASGRGVLDG